MRSISFRDIRGYGEGEEGVEEEEEDDDDEGEEAGMEEEASWEKEGDPTERVMRAFQEELAARAEDEDSWPEEEPNNQNDENEYYEDEEDGFEGEVQESEGHEAAPAQDTHCLKRKRDGALQLSGFDSARILTSRASEQRGLFKHSLLPPHLHANDGEV